MRRLLSGLLLVGLLMPLLCGLASAQSTDTIPPTTDTVPAELGNMLPGPDAGPEPQDAGDRGGWAQLTLLGVIAGAVTIVLLRLFRAANRGAPPPAR